MKPTEVEVVVLEGDFEIMAMLADEGITLTRPTPPNDMTYVLVRNSDHYWIVVRFWHPGDEGYIAYGVHESTSPELRKAFATEIIAGLTEQAHAAGIPNPWEFAEYHEVKFPKPSRPRRTKKAPSLKGKGGRK